MYIRDFAIMSCVRQSDLPVKRVLETRREDVLWDDESVLLQNTLIKPIPRVWGDYMSERDRLFPDSDLLFTTVDGNQYYPDKFGRRVRKLMDEAGVEATSPHPRRLTEKQYQALDKLRFNIQRQHYQIDLAVALCSYLGMRPSEVAKLEKRHIDFGAGLISLRETKSQEDQVLPLLSVFILPVRRFVRYLDRNTSPLFINTKGVKWERRDVTRTIANWGEERGIENLTPRKLRASLGLTLARLKVDPGLIAKVLRHKDPATALRHYDFEDVEEARQYLEEAQHTPGIWQNRDYQKEFLAMYADLKDSE
jgi:integrase